MGSRGKGQHQPRLHRLGSRIDLLLRLILMMEPMEGQMRARRSEVLQHATTRKRRRENNLRGRDKRLRINGKGVPSVEELMVSLERSG